MKLEGIRGFLGRALSLAEREAEKTRARRLVLAASVAGLRAELAFLEQAGPKTRAEHIRSKLEEVTADLDAFEREVSAPAEARRARAEQRSSRFEAFAGRVMAGVTSDGDALLDSGYEVVGRRPPVPAAVAWND
jgi:hypothetical protein